MVVAGHSLVNAHRPSPRSQLPHVTCDRSWSGKRSCDSVPNLIDHGRLIRTSGLRALSHVELGFRVTSDVCRRPSSVNYLQAASYASLPLPTAHTLIPWARHDRAGATRQQQPTTPSLPSCFPPCHCVRETVEQGQSRSFSSGKPANARWAH